MKCSSTWLAGSDFADSGFTRHLTFDFVLAFSYLRPWSFICGSIAVFELKHTLSGTAAVQFGIAPLLSGVFTACRNGVNTVFTSSGLLSPIAAQSHPK